VGCLPLFTLRERGKKNRGGRRERRGGIFLIPTLLVSERCEGRKKERKGKRACFYFLFSDRKGEGKKEKGRREGVQPSLSYLIGEEKGGRRGKSRRYTPILTFILCSWRKEEGGKKGIKSKSSFLLWGEK